MTCNNPKLDLVNINADLQFGEIMSSSFKILSGNEKRPDIAENLLNWT